MKKVTKSPVFITITLATLVAAIGFTFFSINSTFDNLSDSISASATDAVLASTNLSVDSITAIPVAYFSQIADPCVNLYDANSKTALESRQFEWTECGYRYNAFEQGLVEQNLDDDYLPIATSSGNLTANRGINATNFNRWFHATADQSEMVSKTIDLKYSAVEKTFSFSASNFQPLENSKLFTMNVAIPFVALNSGDEIFEITADDDTWVFVGNQLVLDMGGVHEAMTGTLTIRANGEIGAAINGEELAYSGIQLEEGAGSVIRIFHANRDGAESTFKITFKNMYLNIFNTSIASNDNGVIAYNESDPTYVAPLGESKVVSPDHSRAILTSVIAQFFILGILLILAPIIIRFAIERRQK